MPNWRTAAYPRDLLMECGVLPRQDRRLLLFQRWLAERLAATTNPEHEQLLRHFAHWHQLRKLRAKADVGPLSVSTGSRPPRLVPSSPGSPAEAALWRRQPKLISTPGTPRTTPPAARHNPSCAGAWTHAACPG